MVENSPPQFSFKLLAKDHLPILLRWFQQPHVQQWWPVPLQDEFFERFLRRIRSKDTVAYVVYSGEIPIGYIQYYYIDRAIEKTGGFWLPELPETTVGTDQFIGDPAYLGKGYGTLFIKQFIRDLITTLAPTITTIIVDPDPKNHIAIRCYEKVGFKQVGIFKVSDGSALLMRYDVK
jgi:RimJ/RimL family protein N-acetyltransferase